MDIAGWIKNSTVDYPGHLCTVVFTPGCNFDCDWCHNKSFWSPPYEHTSDDVLDFLEKRVGLLDGIAISGGEPTLQTRLPEFIKSVKEMGFKVKLDTNGSRPKVVNKLLGRGLLDYIALDYKAPWRLYDRACGCRVNIDAIRECAGIVIESGVDYELRTTVLDWLTLEHLVEMAEDMPVLHLYALQLFRPLDGCTKGERDAKWIEAAAGQLREYQPNIVVRA